ncbi:MAG: aminoacyl-tRNA deacylase [Deltaproteobacteria bacterium]|nr:aminoacyl-tRNA deacylase [Deltaproteobacteria bacterium]MBW2171471.1 aminoacyl-tRNA deacylase [Deltaproteobacteria bacterium]
MTRAVQFLKRRRVSFEIVEYGHLEKGALFASEAIGMPLEQTVKTLVVEIGKKDYVTLLMPGTKKIALKKLARSYGEKTAAMVDSDTAERLTGYVVGGISPFAMKQGLPVVIDKGLLGFDQVAVNGGKRGLMLVMSPRDLLKVTDAEPAEL